MTFVAGLRHDRIEAPFLVDCPMNGEIFRYYVERVLAPTLKAGDIVILDNLGSHKGQAIRQTIRATGARILFLPPYSPDLNPIEQSFSKFKHEMRKAAERSIEAILKRIRIVIDAYSPSECLAYLNNSGYGSI